MFTLSAKKIEPTATKDLNCTVYKVVASGFKNDISKCEHGFLIVDGNEGYQKAKNFMKILMPSHVKKIRKYRPPNHWEDDLQRISVGSKYLISLNIEKPVPVNPETDSKIELINVTW